MLDQVPEFAPVLFPDLFRFTSKNEKLTNSVTLSFTELKKAFMTFVRNVPCGIKVCFIIDGVDEYDGDHNEISELFKEATKSSSIKVLISSRPIPACVAAFSGFPKLRLQDLTRDDIKQYIEDKLDSDPLMQRLDSMEEGSNAMLREGIISKAAGVFLWVILVVKRLLTGLQDYDTVQDLLERLNELPPELEDLYGHMLDSMSVEHRRQGSKLLQLVLRSKEIDEERYQMTLLQLFFAEDEYYQRAVNSRISPLSQKDQEWRCEVVEGRMRSRCYGLIEAQSSSNVRDTITDPLADLYSSGLTPGFLHRTTMDFLQTDTIKARLTQLTEGTPFEVNRALLSSSLLEFKAKPSTAAHGTSLPISTFSSALRFLVYGLHANKEIWMAFEKGYVPELRNTLCVYEHAQSTSGEAERRTLMQAIIRGERRLDLTFPDSLLFHVAHLYHSPPYRHMNEISQIFYIYRKNATDGGIK